MTPEECAKAIRKEHCAHIGCRISPAIATALREAVAEKDAEIERLREALKKIAAYDDHLAQKHLEETGSYGAFDEPGSVGMAREALEKSND